MRNNIIVAAAVAAAVLTSSAAFAGEKIVKHTNVFGYASASSDYNRPEGFTVLRPGDQSKGTSAFIKKHANTAEAQAQLRSDRELASELSAHRVQLKNVIGISKAMNGKLIIYIK